MKEIIFFDSGIGGISLLNKARKAMPRENFVYVADNLNVPYGGREEEEIARLAKNALDGEIKTTTKAVVIGCNTITSLLISDIRKTYPSTLVFGIEPELKSPQRYGYQSTLLIATEKTCEVVEKKKLKNLEIYPSKTLAKTIEREIFNKEEIYREIKKIKNSFSKKFDSLVLGCTHYALVCDVFRYAFSQDIAIFDGTVGTVRNIARRVGKERAGFGSVRLHLSKDSAKEKLKYVSLIN